MKALRQPVLLWVLVLILLASSLSFAQERVRRVPWEERAPALGKIVPDVKIFDEELNNIPFSNLYKNTLLIVQWGGCT